MAIAAANMVFIGQPGSAGAQGQQDAGFTASGPLSKILVGIATLTLDGTLLAGVVNFIDGVQKLYQTSVTFSVGSVAAPATIGGVANQAVYTSVGPVSALRVGETVTFAGFANAGNNGSFTINALTTSTIQVTNSGSVAESNPQGSALANLGAHVAGVQVSRSMYSAAGVADTAANTITVSGSTLSDTGFTATASAAGTVGQTLSVLVEVFPSA